MARQDSQSVVDHALYDLLTGVHGVGADMGGDHNIRKAEKRVVPGKKTDRESKFKSKVSENMNLVPLSESMIIRDHW